MMPVDEAIERIFKKLPMLGSESVPLSRAHSRVLARPLVATHSQPPFDASDMDGYALRAAEVIPGRPLKLALLQSRLESLTCKAFPVLV